MKVSPPLKSPVKVSELLRRRLRELNLTPGQLAEAALVSEEYMNDLLAGRRRPPLPGRTDIYERMTPLLRLGRNDLVTCARAERAEDKRAPRPAGAEVERLLLSLCKPETARELELRRRRQGATEFTDLAARVLEVAQGAVRRMLADQIGLRVSAAQRGSTLLALRVKLLEFLDATPETLTADDVLEFLQPRIELWDVDLSTGVLRVVLRSQEPREPRRRAGGQSAG